MKQSGENTVLGGETTVRGKVIGDMNNEIRLKKDRRFKRCSPVLALLLGLVSCLLLIIVCGGFYSEKTLHVGIKSAEKEKPIKSRPHVVFLLADDYGFNDIGYHGSKIRTPVMDNLAKEGVILENYYVQPKCSPTRSQLLSGRYQIHTGLQHGTIKAGVPNCLPLDEETLPENLKKLGYTTHMVGKWHLGFYRKACLPTKRGFDSFFGILLGSGGHWSHETQGGYDFRVNENVARQYKNKYSTTLYARQARKIIMSHKPDKPLFLYVPFQAVHTPLEVPESYSLPYKDVFRDRNRQIYAGMVTCLDEAVGNITAALKEKGIYDNTVIIFSTDNGAQVHSSGGSNWPLRGMKGTLWEGGIRGVGFVHSQLLPQSIRGTVNRQLIHVSDWFPTIVEGIAKGKYRGAKPLDGYNIWESIRKNKPSRRKEILHNIDSLRLPLTSRDRWGKQSVKKIFDVGQRAAIRQGDWKLITGTSNRFGWYAPADSHHETIIPERNSGKVLWLFNITADPYEQNDLSEKHVDVVMKLLRQLAKYNQTAVHPKYPPPDPAADPSKHGGVWGPWARKPPKGFEGIYGPFCSKGHSAACVKTLKNINDDIDNYDVIIKEALEQEIIKASDLLKLTIKNNNQRNEQSKTKLSMNETFPFRAIAPIKQIQIEEASLDVATTGKRKILPKKDVSQKVQRKKLNNETVPDIKNHRKLPKKEVQSKNVSSKNGALPKNDKPSNKIKAEAPNTNVTILKRKLNISSKQEILPKKKVLSKNETSTSSHKHYVSDKNDGLNTKEVSNKNEKINNKIVPKKESTRKKKMLNNGSSNEKKVLFNKKDSLEEKRKDLHQDGNVNKETLPKKEPSNKKKVLPKAKGFSKEKRKGLLKDKNVNEETLSSNKKKTLPNDKNVNKKIANKKKFSSEQKNVNEDVLAKSNGLIKKKVSPNDGVSTDEIIPKRSISNKKKSSPNGRGSTEKIIPKRGTLDKKKVLPSGNYGGSAEEIIPKRGTSNKKIVSPNDGLSTAINKKKVSPNKEGLRDKNTSNKKKVSPDKEELKEKTLSKKGTSNTKKVLPKEKRVNKEIVRNTDASNEKEVSSNKADSNNKGILPKKYSKINRKISLQKEHSKKNEDPLTEKRISTKMKTSTKYTLNKKKVLGKDKNSFKEAKKGSSTSTTNVPTKIKASHKKKVSIQALKTLNKKDVLSKKRTLSKKKIN